MSKGQGERKMKAKKLMEVMRSTPNCLGTFDSLMLLGHTLHEKNGRNYYVQINWKEDCVVLSVEE